MNKKIKGQIKKDYLFLYIYFIVSVVLLFVFMDYSMVSFSPTDVANRIGIGFAVTLVIILLFVLGLLIFFIFYVNKHKDNRNS